jgi:hypothetical protein
VEYYEEDPYIEAVGYTMDELGVTLEYIDRDNGEVTVRFITQNYELKGQVIDFRLVYDPAELLAHVTETPTFAFSLTYVTDPCYDTSFVTDFVEVPEIEVQTLNGGK